jgi:hypothetical protein
MTLAQRPRVHANGDLRRNFLPFQSRLSDDATMDRGIEQRDVALILTGDQWLGTGTLVAPGRILTAYHVVFDNHGQEKPALRVRLEGDANAMSASVKWAGSIELDVAVLEANIERKPPMHPLLGLSPENIATDSPWEAHGYPAVRDDQPSTRLEQVRGKACSFIRGNARMNLDVDAAPEKFNGLSGGAVVVRDRIVGIMRAVPNNWGGKRLEATPVSVFWDEPDFRKALGLRKEDEQIAARVMRVIDNVARLIEKHDQLIALLVARLEITYAPGDGARAAASALVKGRKAMDIAKMLNHLDAELVKASASKDVRGALRSVLWQMLPFAIDWQALVVLGVATFTSRGNAIDLPLRSETIAEIVLAGIDDRCCRFAPPLVGQMPVGATVVRIPALAQSALLDRDGARLAQLIVKQLAAEMNIQGHTSQYVEMRDEVEAILQYHAFEAPDDERLPYYLLFLEADLHGKETEHDIWTLARTRLSEELPSLRLVRLTGGNTGQETLLAKHIDAICRRT